MAEIEMGIQIVKERGRAVVSTLPFDVLPKMIIVNVIKFGVFWINAFPVKNGCSEVLSPREVLTQMKISFLKHCQVPFRTYCEVHNDPSITNTIKARTHGDIAMGPTGNFQGSRNFFCLDQGKVISRRNFTKMVMPVSVIKRVDKWGKKSKKEVFGRDLAFRNRNRDKFEWDGDDDLLEKPDYQQHPGIVEEFPGVVLERYQVSPVLAIEELILYENVIPRRRSQIHLSQEWIPQRRTSVDHGLTW